MTYATCQATDGETYCTLQTGHDIGAMATLHEQHGRPWEFDEDECSDDVSVLRECAPNLLDFCRYCGRDMKGKP
jgi:hypothetical protein